MNRPHVLCPAQEPHPKRTRQGHRMTLNQRPAGASPPRLSLPEFLSVETRAACADHDPELWFSTEPEDRDAAKRICRGCPLRQRCADYAASRHVAGVWGGTSRYDRQQAAAAGRARLEAAA